MQEFAENQPVNFSRLTLRQAGKRLGCVVVTNVIYVRPVYNFEKNGLSKFINAEKVIYLIQK